MSVRKILEGENNPHLRAVAAPLKSRSRDIGSLLDDLCDTATEAAGVGLAAPQIGIGKQVCVVKITGEFVALLNPEIVWMSEEREVMEEGCLSLPGVAVAVPRAKAITLRYRDRKWKEQARKLTNLHARIVQHEVDHLRGVLIVDYLASEGVG